ncbi:hypothetical protein [Leptospira santarosai]|uniref:hypothetical protein n=1 Tax=Leptospira santarosai TaxID=28183 RepID=UPI0002BF338E|nr:hypothetical protein [Leptospira santarosai]EMO22499.1 hypothetical protein LEP1GSC168_1567 [Leptospira santarosai str. HAI134]MDI7184004.1 leucine-rich repeat domain-containing protein [Leptospira santarosai]
MKHHFGDYLYRNGNYWSIVPNVDRFKYRLSTYQAPLNDAKILTISKTDGNWKRIFHCRNLEELTLDTPSPEQLHAIPSFNQLKRLRITHARPKDIGFISSAIGVQELVLEYVSAFNDLSPISQLKSLKSLHLENLRGVSDFSGLAGLNALKYLRIDGTIDWKQPIIDFNFLAGLPNLEVFELGFVKTGSRYPALKPILHLKRLKRVIIGTATLPTAEYAFLETAFPHAAVCGSLGGKWELWQEFHGYLEFLGKEAGRIKRNHPKAKERCDEFSRAYLAMKKKAATIVFPNRG